MKIICLTGFPDRETTKKWGRIMRLTLFLMVGFLLTASANSYSQSTRLNIKLKDGTVTELMKYVEDNSEFVFLYKNEDLDLEKKVTVELENATIQQVLDAGFAGQNVGWDVYDRQIILHRALAKRMSAENILQQRTITGVVTDQSGQPLPGVTVVVAGTTIGTVTNADGNFSLAIPDGAEILQFSFVGMRTQEIPIDGRTTFTVVMEEETIGIDEVVAIGYGTMKKSDLTGSIASVKNEELTQKSTISIEDALQGRVAGVQIKTTSASPGGGSSIVIRGGNSINSSIVPLYVVDGFPMEPGEANLISPQDIESIEILKDGSSTAIYGSRGANGVIIISTKKGLARETRISYSTFGRMEVPYNTYDLVNGEEFAILYDEAQVNKNSPPVFTGESELYPTPSEIGEGTNWFKELTRNGFAQSHQLSVHGGTQKTSFRFSGNYFDHTGVMIDDDFERGSLSAVVDTEVTSWLKAGINLTGYKHERNIRSNTSYIFQMFPFISVYDDEGNYNFNYFPDNLMNEEYPLVYANERTNLNVSERVTGNFYLEFELIDGLSFKTTVGGYISNDERYQYLPTSTEQGARLGGSASIRNQSTNTFLNDNILSYENLLGDDHKINLMAAYSRQYRTFQNAQLSGTGFTSDKYTYNNINAAETPGIPNSYKNKWQLASYIGRANYIFRDNYLFTLTARADGSSKFGADNRWAFFPSVAFAWRASEEEFLKSVNNISYLKPRVSYGTTGNSDIGLYQSQGLLGTTAYIYGTTRVVGVAANRVVNPDLKWETTKQFDVGLDLGLFENRLFITTDYYYKKTTDLLLDVNINSTSGYVNALKNVGELQNVGFEFSADLKLLDGPFSWDVSGNFSWNRNEITKLPEGGEIVLRSGYKDVEVILKEGNPIGQFKGPAVIGIFNDEAEVQNYVNADGELIQPDAEPGHIKYRDVDGDGKITGDDWEIVGDSNPDFIYSFNNSFFWKNFSLDMFFNGVYGNEIWNLNKTFTIQTDNPRNTLSKEVLDRWTPENKDGSYPKMGSPDRLWAIEDGSYFKLSNVKLNYKVPKVLFGVVQNMDIYLSMQNVFIITDYSGFDPDINTQGNSSINFGSDQFGYPNPRSYTIGLNVTF